MKELTYFLNQVQDPRRAQGVRVSLPAFLEMVILGSMGGYHSLQALSRFFNNNRDFFIDRYQLQHGVPGYTRIRTLLQSISFEKLNGAFYSWAIQFIDEQKEEWVSFDGKSLGSTIINYEMQSQNFHALVSLFVKSKGIALGAVHYQNKKVSEIKAAQDLINQLDRKGIVYTADALHIQKKRLKPSWTQEMTMYYK